MDQAKQDELKKAAAKKAAALVEDGMVLGVGTGSTVKFFIDELGKKKEAGLTLKAVVTTSSRSQKQLEDYGFTVSPLSEVDQVDLTVDGADRVDGQ
ncbi:ribose-5-phosphate isomerase A, partial [Lactobacillus nasalidis]